MISGDKMDLWMVMKERSMFLSIFTLMVLMSLILLFSVWKNRAQLPKILLIAICILGSVIIIFALIGFVFTMNFGYNA